MNATAENEAAGTVECFCKHISQGFV